MSDLRFIRCVKNHSYPMMREMEMMMDDVDNKKPQKIILNVAGVLREFDGVNIELNNGFMRVMDDDEISVIRFKDISSYHISSFMREEWMREEGLKEMRINEMLSSYEDVLNELSSASSTISPAFLKSSIPHDVKKSIVLSFMGEYHGYSEDEMWDEIESEIKRGDEWRFYGEIYESYMELKTYGDLNSSMSEYLWDMEYPSHIIEDRIKCGDFNDVDDLKSSLSWINDVISDYVDIKEADKDERD